MDTLGNVCRFLAWISFALIGATLVHGLIASGLFAQEIWSPEGWNRFRAYLFIYWAAAVPVLLFAPATIIPAAICGALTFAVAANGVVPVVSAFLLIIAAVAIGISLFERFNAWHASAEQALLAGILGLAIVAFLVGICVHFPVNRPIVYWLAMLTPIVWRPSRAMVALRLLWRHASIRRSRTTSALIAVNCFLALTHWLIALKPEVSADGLAMHLVIPATVANTYQWHFDVDRFSWAVMPMAGDWVYTCAYLLGGEHAARQSNALLLFIATALMGFMVRRWVSESAALVLTGTFLATPLVQLVTGSLFIENFLAALLVGALVLVGYRDSSNNSKYAWLAAVFCGTAIAAKLGASTAAIPIAIAAIWPLLKSRRSMRDGAIAIALFLLTSMPPYAVAWARTGNPIFPFANEIFRSPDFDQAPLLDQRFRQSLNWRTLYDVTFNTSRFLESQDGAIGFHYLLLIPLAFVMFRPRQWPREGAIALIVATLGCIFVFYTQANARYIYPMLPLWLVAVGPSWKIMQDTDAALYRAVLAGTAGLAAISVYFLPASGWYHKDFMLPLRDGTARNRYIDELAPGRLMVDYLNRVHAGESVLFFVNGQTAGLKGRVYLNSWHTDNFYRVLRSAVDIAEVGQALKRAGVRYVVAPSPRRMHELPQPALRLFVESCIVTEYEVNGYFVGRVRSEEKAACRGKSS